MTPALQAVLAAGAYVGALLAAAWLARALYRAGQSIIGAWIVAAELRDEARKDFYESPAGHVARAAGNETHVFAADNDAASAPACAGAAGDTFAERGGSSAQHAEKGGHHVRRFPADYGPRRHEALYAPHSTPAGSASRHDLPGAGPGVKGKR